MLKKQIAEAARKALSKGSLKPISTRSTIVRDQNITFIIRIVSSLKEKSREGERRKVEKKKTAGNFNPFLPYDQDMFVAHFGERHVGLLNKFPVLANHLLLVTKDFEEQTRLLNRADFDALWQAMARMDGLGFYNGGRIAGASQRHKHLQLVPFPLDRDHTHLPFENLLRQASEGLHSLPLPFDHYFARPAGSEAANQHYRKGMEALNLWSGNGFQNGDYNLLCTAEWLMIVPRMREKLGPISVNALGFAGALLARNEEELALIKETGPMNLLIHTGRPH